MPTPAEIQEMASKWGVSVGQPSTSQPPQTQPQVNAVPGVSARQAPTAEDVSAMASKWISPSTGVNAPPGSITATPQMDMTGLYGRRDTGGNLVPIDQHTGIPLGDYWSVGWHSDPKAKADALQKLYPDKKVRILDTGDVTLQIDGADGKPRDVIINPTGVSREDLIDLATSAPEVAASLATFLATKGKGAIAATARLVGSALAGGFTGEVKDVATRGTTGIPIRPGEISKERGAQSLMDIAGGGALGLFGRYGSRILSPFAREVKPGSLAFDLRQGTDFLRKNYGAEIPTTAGERTGSPALLAIEAAESPMPGARNIMDPMRSERDRAIQQAARIASGNALADDEIGSDAFIQLRNRVVQPLENAFMEARDTAMQKGDKRVLALLDNAVGRTPQGQRITPAQAGTAASEAFSQRIAKAEDAVNAAYAKVNALPGGTGDVLDGSAAAKAASEIRKELPQVATTKEAVQYDQYGSPMTKEVPTQEILKSGVPDGLLKALDDLESLKGGKVSLQTLTNMKKAAFDAIAAFKTAHGDVKDRWFNKIAGAYENGIQQGIDSTENLDLKNALTAARDTYKKEMVPLERVGLKEMAKTEFDPGHLSPTEIANRLFEGPKALQNYQMLEETLGQNNVALRALKRAYVDTKLADAFDPVLKTYNPDQLGAVFKQMQVNSPELSQKLVGNNYQPLMEALAVKKAMQKAGVQAIDESELRTLLNLKDPTVQDLRDVLRMGKQRNKAYVNGIFNDVKDGIELNDFEPNKFVSRLRDADVSTAQLKDVLSNLKPATRDAIATAEFYRILNESTVKEGATAASRAGGGQGNLSATKIVDALGTSAEERAKTSLLLAEDLAAPGSKPPIMATGGVPQESGANRSDVLLNLIKTLAPREAAKTVFSGLGSVSSATAAREMTTGPLKYVTGFAKNMFLAASYLKLAPLLTNTQFGPEGSAVVANTLIASEPFLRVSVDAFGSAMTKSMVNEVKSSIDRYVMELQNSPEGRRRAATQSFIQGKQVPMNIQPGPATNAKLSLQQLQDRMLKEMRQKRAFKRPQPEPLLAVPAQQP